MYLQTGAVDSPLGYELLFLRILSEVGLIIPVLGAHYWLQTCNRAHFAARSASIGTVQFDALMIEIQSRTNPCLNTPPRSFAFCVCIGSSDAERAKRLEHAIPRSTAAMPGSAASAILPAAGREEPPSLGTPR